MNPKTLTALADMRAYVPAMTEEEQERHIMARIQDLTGWPVVLTEIARSLWWAESGELRERGQTKFIALHNLLENVDPSS